MKILFYIVFLCLMFCNPAFSQSDTAKTANNSLYLEVGGAGGYGSVNYERIINSSKMFMLSIRLGLSTYHLRDYTTNFNPDLIVPFSVNGSYGKNHKLELDLGQVYASTVVATESSYEPGRESDFHTFLSIGYRYQKNTGGLLFRCSYTPIIEFNRYFRQWLGISIGYSF